MLSRALKFKFSSVEKNLLTETLSEKFPFLSFKTVNFGETLALSSLVEADSMEMVSLSSNLVLMSMLCKFLSQSSLLSLR